MLDKLLNPKSIAVVGAAREEGKVGHVILDNLLEAGFRGQIYPVNPKADKIHNLTSYPSLTAIKKPVDLVVIVTPAKTVPLIIEEAGKSGAEFAVVISAGFKEASLEGARLEKEIIEISGKYNLRLLGPNCLGIINAHSGANASFTRVGPLKGNIAFISQSGALQTAVLDMSYELEIGFSKFISLGNKADLNEADFMEALAGDEQTKVIALYLEGVTDGSRFLKSASRIVQKKPIIALKAGRTAAGARAVSSHTGTLAGSERAYTAAFTQSGVIQPNSLQQLFAYATALAKQPLPKGNSIGILTNAGGPAILASDHAKESALTLAGLKSKTIESLSSFLPPAANVYNPVDILGDAKADRYQKALQTLEADENVDGLLVILTPQAMTEITKTARLVVKAARVSEKPVIASFMGGPEVKQAVKILQENNIPNYVYPEQAVKTMGSLVTYKRILERPKAVYVSYEVDDKRVKEILKKAQKEERVNLSYLEANEILQAFGLKVPQSHLARSAKEAAKLAAETGFPVALKIMSPDILHKTDIGGVRVNLSTKEEIVAAYDNIINNAKRLMPQARIDGILVQKMIKAGEETIVGINRDSQFGPLVLFGLGGIYVEIMKDVSFRIAPLSKMDVKIMLNEVKFYMLLKGVRGRRARDIKAIEEVIFRVSQLATHFKEIVEMDINPLMVLDEGGGAIVADVRINIDLK